MKIHQGIDNFKSSNHVILTTGTFDGVHIGHQKMLTNLIAEAKKNGLESVLLTFYPHPRMVLYPDDHNLKLLTAPKEKHALLEKIGIDHLIIQPFDDKFSSISAHNYIRDVLVNKLGVKKIIAGYDHRFGKNREGDYETLSSLGNVFDYSVTQITAREIEEVKISSTKIRSALDEGKIEIAEKYLGRKYSITGTVVAGEKLGSQLGFPTANIEVNYQYKQIPKIGVYAVKVEIEEKTIDGMLNIGTRPTVSNENLQTIEVHLFDWEDDIYTKSITVTLVKRVREEQKFNTKEALILQLKKDQEEVQKILNK